MRDPWADVRKWKLGNPVDNRLREVLDDADALLAVARADKEYDDALAEWFNAIVNTNDTERQEIASERLGMSKDKRANALAALPEHLKNA